MLLIYQYLSRLIGFFCHVGNSAFEFWFFIFIILMIQFLYGLYIVFLIIISGQNLKFEIQFKLKRTKELNRIIDYLNNLNFLI